MNFLDFNLKDELNLAIKEAGFKEPSPIQKEAIPLILDGNDLIGQAHTGTGKTAAFGLPILDKIDPKNGVEALVIVPTRELATQVSDEIYRFGKYLNIKSATVYGGSSYSRQIEHIKKASIVVATPGRLLDLLENKKISIKPKFVVLDEADEMLDMGFLEDIQKIFAYLPKERQTLLFSATMSKEIKELAQKILKDPKSVSITKSEVTNSNINQQFYVVEENERDDALIRLLDFKDPQKAIIFCRMKKEVDRLRDFLNAQGYNTKGLHGDMDQREREAVIRSFKKGSLELLIATDVAARGLDVEGVTHVINYHLPFDSASYVHRIGRTGRAGKDGEAISIVTPSEFRALWRIQKSIGSQIQSKVLPRIEDVLEKRESTLEKSIQTQNILPQAINILEKLKKDLDLETIALKVISLLAEDEKVKGADIIGKDQKEIKKLFQKALKRDPKQKRGRSRRKRSRKRS
jgi:ATP-dependent RNA helicase DeaD